jgi:hypothetical protein
MFEMPMPGVFVVRYRSARDMDPLLQGTLIEAVRSSSRLRPVVLIFVIAETIRSIDFAVPSFWIKVAADPAVRIGAMGMVTDSLAVEIAAKSFGAATRFREHPIEVKTFRDEVSATKWARALPLLHAPAHA